MLESEKKALRAEHLFSQFDEQVAGMPEQVLLSLARNPAAQKEWRKAAVRKLVEMHSRFANHEDLALMLLEVKSELDAESEVESIVESQIEAPLGEGKALGVLTAGVTTQNLMQEEIVNPAALGPDALGDTFPDD